MTGQRIGFFALEFPMGRNEGARVAPRGLDMGPSVTLDADLADYAVMLRVNGHTVWGGLGQDRVYEATAIHLVASDGQDEPYSWHIVHTYQGRGQTSTKHLLEAANRARFLVAAGREAAMAKWFPWPEPTPPPVVIPEGQKRPYEVTITVAVSAKTPKQAVEFAMDDLRDTSLGAWAFHVEDMTTGKSIRLEMKV